MSMSSVDQKRMAWAARRLTAVANARTMEAADRRLYRLSRWAARSARNMDAAFAAAQMLRDFETIDRAEAELSVVHDKPSSEDSAESKTPPGAPSALSEHVLALSATETLEEWMAAWPVFCQSLRGADAASAVATARGLRDVGSISFNE